jgi:hypothetical protein
METSGTLTNFAPAFLAAQKAMGAAKKDANNPFFKSKYADFPEIVATVKGPLTENGISYIQSLGMCDGQQTVRTTLLHESGEFITDETPVISKSENNPQDAGSGITYCKRYALAAICGLPTVDDDAEAAMYRNSDHESPQHTESDARNVAQEGLTATPSESVFSSPEFVELKNKYKSINPKASKDGFDSWASGVIGFDMSIPANWTPVRVVKLLEQLGG